LDIEEAFDTTWHPGLLYKLSKLQISSTLIRLICSFLSNRKFRVMVEGQLSTPPEYTSRGAARFRPGPYPVWSVHKRHSSNSRGLPSPLCRWYMYIYNRSQRGLCSQKTATRSHLNGAVVWT